MTWLPNAQPTEPQVRIIQKKMGKLNEQSRSWNPLSQEPTSKEKTTWKAILECRNAMTPSQDSSLVQGLKSRRTKSFLPCKESLYKPDVLSMVLPQVEKKHKLAKHYQDINAKPLPGFCYCDAIYWRSVLLFVCSMNHILWYLFLPWEDDNDVRDIRKHDFHLFHFALCYLKLTIKEHPQLPHNDWNYSVVLKNVAPHSYLVEVHGSKYHWNQLSC